MNESYLYADKPFVAIYELIKEYICVKFEKNFHVISTPKQDIKFTFIMDENEIKKKKKHYCKPY